MKNYTISLDLFNESDEIFSSLDIINNNFEGLIDVDNFFRLNGLKDQKVKLSVILAFQEVFNEKDQSKSEHRRDSQSVTQLIYNGGRTNTNSGRELLLARYASVSEEFLLNADVNIEEALSQGFIREVRFIHFTDLEISTLLMFMDESDIRIDKEDFETLKRKLNGDTE